VPSLNVTSSSAALVTVIVSTHRHAMLALVDRLIVMDGGQILADGTLTSLRQNVLGERRLRVQFAEEVGELEIPGTTLRQRSGRSVELSFDPRTTPAHSLIADIAARYDVEDVHVDEPPIDEVVARFYARHELEGR